MTVEFGHVNREETVFYRVSRRHVVSNLCMLSFSEASSIMPSYSVSSTLNFHFLPSRPSDHPQGSSHCLDFASPASVFCLWCEWTALTDCSKWFQMAQLRYHFGGSNFISHWLLERPDTSRRKCQANPSIRTHWSKCWGIRSSARVNPCPCTGCCPAYRAHSLPTTQDKILAPSHLCVTQLNQTFSFRNYNIGHSLPILIIN